MTEGQALDFIAASPVGIGTRVTAKMARAWLLDNKSIVCGGNVFFLQIENLGLGVCEVSRAPLSVRKTLVVKNVLLRV